jgi:hypothetical protein
MLVSETCKASIASMESERRETTFHSAETGESVSGSREEKDFFRGADWFMMKEINGFKMANETVLSANHAKYANGRLLQEIARNASGDYFTRD